jgi:uncharacterized protein YacL
MQLVTLILICFIILMLASDTKRFSSIARLVGRGRRQIILDSCTLIDGRIVDLVRTGFIADELVIPKFILGELQMLADGNDTHKRERARFGLEIAAELQEYAWASVRLDTTNFPGATDDKLVKLAKKIHGLLCTTDYNLNKVAAVEGVRTLNIHELAQTLRPVTLPGEKIEVKIIQQGSNPDQGVGYLEDGTMIVVDGAAKQVGAKIHAVVDRMHQTVAGKMVFAHQVKSKTQADTLQKIPAKSQHVPLSPQAKRNRLVSLSPRGALARSRKSLSPRHRNIQ